MLSKRAHSIFFVASIVTFVSCAIVAAVAVIDVTMGLPSLETHESILAIVGIGLILLALLIDIVMQAALWLGMIWVTLTDDQPILTKAPMVASQIIFLSLGSAIVYLVFFRSGLRQLNKANVSDVLST